MIARLLAEADGCVEVSPHAPVGHLDCGDIAPVQLLNKLVIGNLGIIAATLGSVLNQRDRANDEQRPECQRSGDLAPREIGFWRDATSYEAAFAIRRGLKRCLTDCA